jgi:protein-arginine kinase activator protein McsA
LSWLIFLYQLYENIFEIAGVNKADGPEPAAHSNGSTPSSGRNSNEDLTGLGIEELQSLLNEVLEQEDYIRAIAIRDEINSRK